MSPIPSPLLLADIFDRLRLQLPDPIVNWLTPVWILCVGVLAGLLLTAALWGILWLISKIPGVSAVAEQPTNRRIAIAVLTVLLFGGLASAYLRASAAPAVQAPAAAAADAQANAAVAGAPVVAAKPVDRVWGLVGCFAAAWLLATGIVFLSGHRALA